MVDAEKVIKGLECCKECTQDDPFQLCDECPYNDISIVVQDCRAVLSAEALELLKEPIESDQVEVIKEQDPAKPVTSEDMEKIIDMLKNAEKLSDGDVAISPQLRDEVIELLKDQDKFEHDARFIMSMNFELLKRLENRPEVVRCKDCKYQSEPELGYTFGTCQIRSGWSPVKDDWYCADGVRKYNG